MQRASGTVESLEDRSETRTAARADHFAETLVFMRGVARRYKNLVNKLSKLELKPRIDGMTDVRIDGGKQFTLPPALADLISALSVDTGVSDDALAGWKSVKEVAALLSKQSGRPVSKRAITQNVYRLRKELFERGGVNPYLVQTNRRRGLADNARAPAGLTCSRN